MIDPVTILDASGERHPYLSRGLCISRYSAKGTTSVVVLALALLVASSASAQFVYNFERSGPDDVIATLELSSLPATLTEFVSLSFSDELISQTGVPATITNEPLLVGSTSFESFIDDGQKGLTNPGNVAEIWLSIPEYLIILEAGPQDSLFIDDFVVVDFFYRGDWRLVPGPSTMLDFNNDFHVDVIDIDALVGEIIADTHDPAFDLSVDGAVDDVDLMVWLSDAAAHNGFGAAYLLGDANLDGAVNAADLNAMGQNWQGHPNAWQQGDFTTDGTVDGRDLEELAQNWQVSIPFPATAVPESVSCVTITFVLVAFVLRRK